MKLKQIKLYFYKRSKDEHFFQTPHFELHNSPWPSKGLHSHCSSPCHNSPKYF